MAYAFFLIQVTAAIQIGDQEKKIKNLPPIKLFLIMIDLWLKQEKKAALRDQRQVWIMYRERTCVLARYLGANLPTKCWPTELIQEQ